MRVKHSDMTFMEIQSGGNRVRHSALIMAEEGYEGYLPAPGPLS